jgi:hypothetical protein
VPDRLDELRRQRALQREHLDWIDREIAALEGGRRAPLGSTPPLFTAEVPDPSDADAILMAYREPAETEAKQAKRGCLLVFVVGLVLLLASLGAMYFYVKAHRGP